MSEPENQGGGGAPAETSEAPVVAAPVTLSQPAATNGTWVASSTTGTAAQSSWVDPLPAIRRTMTSEGLVPEDWNGDIEAQLRTLATERRQDKLWADIGRTARDRKVAEVKAEGVRALGAQGFKEAAYQRTFDAGSWDELDALHEQFRSIAGMRLQGGRLTQERPDEDDARNGRVYDEAP